jgi:hypothetical protein
MLLIESKRKKGLCIAYRCPSKPGKATRFCYKHHKRYQKEKNFLVYSYSYLKQNAKRRGKSFSLTLDQFKEFCNMTGYLMLKGKLKKSASIDRIDNSKGYSFDNIQVLTLSQNSAKGAKDEEDYPF